VDPVIYPHTAQQPYRPLEGRLLAVKVVFWLIAGIWLLAIVNGLFELPLASRWADGEAIPASDYVARDNRSRLIGWTQWAGWAAGTVAFILWLYRAYQNVDAVAPGQRRYGYGWSIASWFVPVLNLWRPKQIANDVWRAGGHPLEPPFLLLAWWMGWLAMWVVARFAEGRYEAADTAGEYRTAIFAYLASDALGVSTAILALLVAAKLTRRLNDRASAYAPGDAHNERRPVDP
jgi:hypothetical protein